MTLDKVFLSLHVFGVLMWIGGLFALTAFLEAFAAEPDAAARSRLLKFLRQAAIVPDIGATIAIIFGLHWLFKYKVYQMPYMHIKLTLVAAVIGMHGFLKMKAKKARKGETFTAPPMFLKPLLSLLVIGIVLFVVSKWPVAS
ncbi:MAG TPA: CopD family protein [Kofleriaceae bacterium]